MTRSRTSRRRDDRQHAARAGGASERAGEDHAEFHRLAKAKPGSLNFARSALHDAGSRRFDVHFMAGIDTVEVPYKGRRAGGHRSPRGNVSSCSIALPSMLHHIQSGKLRALGTTGAKRAPQLPDFPSSRMRCRATR